MMNIVKCPKCGSDDIIKGDLLSPGGVVFAPECQTEPIRIFSGMTALACRNCGTVFGFELTDKPEKLTSI